jgi:hypothetical protein
VALGQQSFGDPTAHCPEPDESKISHEFLPCEYPSRS